MQVSTCWTEELDLNNTLSVLRDAALHHCRQGGDVGKILEAMIKHRDWKSLLKYEIDYALDWDVIQLMHCRQALAFFSKLEDLDIGVDKTQVAYDNFVLAEEQCKASNDFFRALMKGSCYMNQTDTRVFYAARTFIHRVLGRCPDIKGLDLRFGPGATTSIKRRDACPAAKLAETPKCSLDLYASGLLPSLMREMPHWLDCHEVESFLDEEGCRISAVDVELTVETLDFVPKNAKTYRTIGKVPTLNSMLQAGIGRAMMNRLRVAGLDLRSTAKNRRGALTGSINGWLATIDLSNASDTISYLLVKFLLPEDWFKLLCAARCGMGSYKGDTFHYQKFSSMGNGFTFPLESLIFWALTRSAVFFDRGDPAECTVYGDDIICPTNNYRAVSRTLLVAGFTLNGAKSYASGKFRESCGGDYYNGINIRPYYQKHLVSGRTLFTLHNWYTRQYNDERTKWVRTLIPTPLRLYGPDGYGDGHLVSDQWTSKRNRRRRTILDDGSVSGYGGKYFESYALESRSIVTKFPGDWVSPLYSIYVKGRALVDPTDTLSEGEVFLSDGRVTWPLPGTGDDGGYAAYSKKLIYTFTA